MIADTLQHLALVFCGLAIGLLVAAALTYLILRVQRTDTAVFAIAGIVYVIPSLALLAVAVK